MRIRQDKSNDKGRLVAGATACSLALLLAACSQGAGQAAEPTGGTATETVTETVQNPDDQNSGGQAAGSNGSSDSGSNNGGSNSGDNNNGGGDSGNCVTDPQAQAIHDVTARVNNDYPNEFGGWTYHGDSNYDTCSPLTYAVVEQTEQGNSQFGTLLLMFHEGQYVGIDSTYPQQVMKATPTDDGVHVVYKD